MANTTKKIVLRVRYVIPVNTLNTKLSSVNNTWTFVLKSSTLLLKNNVYRGQTKEIAVITKGVCSFP